MSDPDLAEGTSGRDGTRTRRTSPVGCPGRRRVLVPPKRRPLDPREVGPPSDGGVDDGGPLPRETLRLGSRVPRRVDTLRTKRRTLVHVSVGRIAVLTSKIVGCRR